MDIGPLSEWVAAFAEILAVCIALFLPYLNGLVEVKKRRKRFSKIILNFANAMLQNNTTSKDSFANFIKIASLIDTDEKSLSLLDFGDELLAFANSGESLSQEQRIRVQDIILILQKY